MKFQSRICNEKVVAILLLFFLSCISFSSFGQSATSSAPDIEIGLDHGIRFNAPDSSLGLRVMGRLQSQYFTRLSLEDEADRTLHNDMQSILRRARLMLKGYLLQEEFSYFINFKFDRGIAGIMDAYLEWHPNSSHSFGVGQFRVFDDRQFRISSAYLQLVERSVVSNEFSHGYDVGVFWKGSWVPQHRMGLKLYTSFTHTDREYSPKSDGGYIFTGRAELLPFGAFRGGGDYRGGGLVRQPDPKLSVGLSASLNSGAQLSYSLINDRRQTDITSLFADAVFKYRGFSFMGELARREVADEIVALPMGTRIPADLYSGYGLLLQAGSMLSARTELNVRYEKLYPEEDTEEERSAFTVYDRYTIGATRYIHGHGLKIQAEVILVDREDLQSRGNGQYLESRIQFQLNF